MAGHYRAFGSAGNATRIDARNGWTAIPLVKSKESMLPSAVNQSWKRAFDDPILLPTGRKLITLLDAATYATKLPKKEVDTAEWQAAIESLMLVAGLGGPTMFARIGVMRALNRSVERTFDSTRKDTHWGKRKLKRDR
jgi:hypothetical protein